MRRGRRCRRDSALEIGRRSHPSRRAPTPPWRPAPAGPPSRKEWLSRAAAPWDPAAAAARRPRRAGDRDRRTARVVGRRQHLQHAEIRRRGNDADDGALDAVEANVRPSAEPVRAKSCSHRPSLIRATSGAARPIFVGRERPARRRGDAEQLQQLRSRAEHRQPRARRRPAPGSRRRRRTRPPLDLAAEPPVVHEIRQRGGLARVPLLRSVSQTQRPGAPAPGTAPAAAAPRRRR